MHEAPVAVQLQFLPEPPGVQAISIGERARKFKREYQKGSTKIKTHARLTRMHYCSALHSYCLKHLCCCVLKNSFAQARHCEILFSRAVQPEFCTFNMMTCHLPDSDVNPQGSQVEL